LRLGHSHDAIAKQVCEAAHDAPDAGVFAARVVALLAQLARADRATLVEVHAVEAHAVAGASAIFPLAFRGRAIATLYLERNDAALDDDALDAVRAALPFVELAWVALRATTTSVSTLSATADLSLLTPRQREIAHLVARGLTTREIAVLLGSSPNTVRNQLSALFRVTHTSTRAELAALVARSVHLSY
jgi:DNA-binding CsgD family transcriptional regulator